MLDGSKFSITVLERDIHNLDNILLLYKEIHASDYNFYFHPTSSDKICLKTCSPAYKEREHYPLDVILPLIKYKAQSLPSITDPYIGGDGSSIRAFEVFEDYHGLNVRRTYLYAGK